ncbi:porin family protein [Shewanella sp. YLB-07]|uniref:porin family protein n=1 Tax=Shewanella sp. YLB-07 TaxID=2601268 RepID=UPI001D157F62|nr:porin family protein [Shewanella sp. YLB-07]
MTKLNTTLIASMIVLSTSAVASEEVHVNPSDLTQVNTFISGSTSNEGDLNVMGGIAGQYSEGNNFIGLVEHTSATKPSDDDRLAQNTRLRYFQVFDVSEGVLPQIGFSVDYMKSWKMSSTEDASLGTDLIALGAIAKIQISESISVFPNVAYVVGNAKAGVNNSEFDLKGYQFNLFGSWELDDTGSYIVVQPQFMQLDIDSKDSKDGKSGGAKVDVLKIKTGAGMAFTDNGKWWVELSHTYTKTKGDVEHVGNKFDIIDNDNKVELAVSYYF